MEGDDSKKKLIVKENDEEELSLVSRMWKENKLMWVVAGPAIFTRFSTFGIQIISQAFIGHIGSTQLAAYALVFTVLVRFANGFLVCSFFINFFSPLFSCSILILPYVFVMDLKEEKKQIEDSELGILIENNH